MQRCNVCGTVDLGEMRAERTGESIQVCGECGSLWRDGDDLAGPPWSDSDSYTPPKGGARWAEFRIVDEPPGSPYLAALDAFTSLTAEGRMGAIAVGVHAGDAVALIGPRGGDARPLSEDRWVPEKGPLRIHVRGGMVAEIVIEPPGGPLPIPGIMAPGPDLSIVSPDEATAALRETGGFVERRDGGMAFDTGRFSGALDFRGYRLTRLRVRPANYPHTVRAEEGPGA
ncbi:MAG: hypothetical protein M0026_13190 [Nocardiopsaceae bacterium]|nr:hypothetical protein [Nocardiopsaceae bacterium]